MATPLSSMRKSELPPGLGGIFELIGAAAGIKNHHLPGRNHRVVIFKLWAAGECLMATPVIAALKAGFPSLHLTVVTGGSCEPLWRMCPGVDRIISLEEKPFLSCSPVKLFKTICSLRAIPADAAVILHHSYFFSTFAALAFPGARSGPDRHGEGFLYHFTEEPESPHRIDDHLAAAYALGAVRGDWCMTISPPQKALSWAKGVLSGDKSCLCVAPGGGHNIKTTMPQKNYPAVKYLAAIELFHKVHDFAVVLIGNEEDRPLTAELTAGLLQAGIDYRDFCGKTNWEETAALINLCRGFVGNDSAPMHLAAALGIPTLGIFGPTSPCETGPRGKHVATIEPERRHDPCYRHGIFNSECADPCIERIEPQEVAIKLNELWT